jgi:hypothetical protein
VDDHAAAWRPRERHDDPGEANRVEVERQPVGLLPRADGRERGRDRVVLGRRPAGVDGDVQVPHAAGTAAERVRLERHLARETDVEDGAHAVLDQRPPPGRGQPAERVGPHQRAPGDAAAVHGRQPAEVAHVAAALPVEAAVGVGQHRRG